LGALVLGVLHYRTLNQRYCVINAFDLERIDEMLVRAINLCANPVSLSELDENADATASYSGAYGYSYQTLKSIKDHIDTAKPFDPSLPWSPF
jgi:hypothetical protein